MRIKEIETRLYRIPFEKPFSDSIHGYIPDFELITVRIRTNTGLEGLGYTYTVGQGGRSVYSLIEDDLKPVLLDQDPRSTESLWDRMWWHIHWVGRGGVAAIAVSAIDIALWDCKARQAQEPLWRFLGGNDPRVPIYTGGIDLQFPLDDLLESMKKVLARGLKALKMKVGRPRLQEDLERVAALRELIGPNIVLMVDANCGWSVAEALRASRALAEYDVYWLEEPIIPDDLAGHVKIAREAPLPIAAGENLRNIYDHKNYIAAGAVTFPEPDAANLGGITPWMKVAHLAEAFNLRVTSHGIHDIHVHTLAAVTNSSYLEEHGFGLEKFMPERLRIEDGCAVAPDRPGHGVALDENILKEFLVPG